MLGSRWPRPPGSSRSAPARSSAGADDGAPPGWPRPCRAPVGARASAPTTPQRCGPRSPPLPTPRWLSTARGGRQRRERASAWRPCPGPSVTSGSRSKKVLHASERKAEERAAWWAATAHLDPTRLVFVDESGTNLAMTPRYGRAPRGQRVVGTAPRNHGPNVTLLAAMSDAGITAAMTMTGATDGAVFTLFVEQVLVPTLRPGQVIIWDNLSVHKNHKLRRGIEAVGCQLHFLPPYSPDFSPIEHAFGKLKTALRRAAARDRPALEHAITAGLATITADDAAAWFRHCGYALPEQHL